MKLTGTLLLHFLATVHGATDETAKNDNDISRLEKIIQTEIIPDIQKTREFLQIAINEKHNDTAALYNYIDNSINRLTANVIQSIKDLKNNTEDKIASLQKNEKLNLEKIYSVLQKNDKSIIEGVVGNNSALSHVEDKLWRRTDKMEKIMSSRLSICASTLNNKLPGRVTNYETILHKATEPWAHADLAKQIRILGRNLTAAEVFDLKSGVFTVPAGAAGEYWISVAMLVDVFEPQGVGLASSFVMSEYRIALNGIEITQARLNSDAGKDENADRVMLSRSIILHLVAGDRLTLKKRDFSNIRAFNDRAPESGTDREITFCISMKHLDEALTLDRPTAPNPKPADALVKGLTDWEYLPADTVPFSPVAEPDPVDKPSLATLEVLPTVLSRPITVTPPPGRDAIIENDLIDG